MSKEDIMKYLVRPVECVVERETVGGGNKTTSDNNDRVRCQQPSIERGGGDDDNNIEGGGGNQRICQIVDKNYCNNHNCQLTKIFVTNKRWGWIEKKKCFGNITSKRVKWICPLRNCVPVAPEIVPNLDMSTTVQHSVQGGEQWADQTCVETRVGRQSESENTPSNAT